MKTLYHGTPKKNAIPIMNEGIKAGVDGLIYFCETPQDCLVYMNLYAGVLNCHEFATIPIEFTEEEFANMGKNVDNSTELPTAYAFKGDIPADRVPHDLHKIPLFGVSLKGKENDNMTTEKNVLAKDADGVSLREIEAFMNEVIDNTIDKIAKLDANQLHIKAGFAKTDAEVYLKWMANYLPADLDPEERQNILYAILIEHGKNFNKLDQERTKAYREK